MQANYVFTKRAGEQTYYNVRTKDGSKLCLATAILLACQKWGFAASTVYFSKYFFKKWTSNSSITLYSTCPSANKPSYVPHYVYKHSTQHNAYYVKALSKYNLEERHYTAVACAKWNFNLTDIKCTKRYTTKWGEVGYKFILH